MFGNWKKSRIFDSLRNCFQRNLFQLVYRQCCFILKMKGQKMLFYKREGFQCQSKITVTGNLLDKPNHCTLLYSKHANGGFIKDEYYS